MVVMNVRLVEILGGLAAIGTIASFLGIKWSVQRTIRGLGRKPESPPPSDQVERRPE